MITDTRDKRWVHPDTISKNLTGITSTCRNCEWALGVEGLGEIKYVTDDYLASRGATMVQRQRFEASCTFVLKTTF